MKYRVYNENIECDFNINQYEDIAGIKYPTAVDFPARYIEQEEIDYRNNLLIEALPPTYTSEQLYEFLENPIAFADEERFKNVRSRTHALMRLKNIFHIWEKHLVLANKIDVIIRRGYTSHELHVPVNIRNAFSKADKLSEIVSSNEVELKLNRVKPQMPGFTIFGVSGGGKSVATENILSFYPQVISHEQYKDKDIFFKQLVWLKIDCSYNGSIKGICEKFFIGVDKALGIDKYAVKFNKSRNVDHAIADMAKVAYHHKLGCLIIDEIQHIVNSKSGSEAVMNFLVTLQNEMKLPIVLIGTYKALNHILMKSYRQARRASGIGELEWGRMTNDYQYRDFLEHIWKYQWLKEPSELTDEMVECFYANTMGNIDRTVKLFQLSQLNAISLELETITIDLVEAVTEELPLTNKIIKAIRNNDYEELAKYDDVYSRDMDKLIQNKIELLEAEEMLREIKLSEESSAKRKERDMTIELMTFAQVMGVTESKSKEYVDAILIADNKDLKMSELKMLLAQYITGVKSVPKKEKAKKMPIPTAEELKASTF
jgi:hypothetical protein